MSASPANIVSLADVHTHLQIPTSDTQYDTVLQWMINAADAVIQFECGDILPTLYTETYDGGGYCIYTRHLPIVSVLNVEEGWGWINYELDFQEINIEPAAAGMFGYSIDNYEYGQISRRSVASVQIPFRPGTSNVIVTYRAGVQSIPADVFLAELELIAHWFQNSQLRAVTLGGTNIAYDAVEGAIYSRDTESGTQNLNIGVPYRILELLKSHRHMPFMA